MYCKLGIRPQRQKKRIFLWLVYLVTVRFVAVGVRGYDYPKKRPFST